MSVSDLTGTKWQINSTTSTAGYGKFTFDAIKFNDVNWGLSDYVVFCVGFQVSCSSYSSSPGEPTLIPEPQAFPEPHALANNVYLYEAYPAYQQISVGDTIEFGTFRYGYDANDYSLSETDLISWLEANATQIQTGHTVTIDGTDYTIDDNTNLLVNSTGLYNQTGSTQLYTYAGDTSFLGFATSSGGSVVYDINGTFTPSADMTLYIVEQARMPLYINGIRTDKYNNTKLNYLILNGVKYYVEEISYYTAELHGVSGDYKYIYIQINDNPTWYWASMDANGGFSANNSNISNITEDGNGSIFIPNLYKIKIGTEGDPTLTTGSQYSNANSTGDFVGLSFTSTGSSEPAYASSEINMTQNSKIYFIGDY